MVRRYKRKSKNIVYIGHSYHKKTRSTEFLINLLSEFFNVKTIFDDSWNGKEFPDLSFINENYDAVIFFQSLPPIEKFIQIKNNNLIYFPMYDSAGGRDVQWWYTYRRLRIINFSRTLHRKLTKWGFKSFYIQYFPKPTKFKPGKNDEVFFWQRISKINVRVITKLFLNPKVKIHIHKAIDPEHRSVEPTKKQIQEYNISFSNWFRNKDDLINCIEDKGIFIAPRDYEGIGLSFLEAMAMGKAVVAVDHPTMNEYIRNKVNGYLYDIKSQTPIDLSNIEDVQKNAYQYIKSGYYKWMRNKSKIIKFINEGIYDI